ncbi:MAG: SPOR domain-containing protein [Muribaculaceae bacterium]|nr:SPOR domain-containing protein [Muribaculaceae bacterium]
MIRIFLFIILTSSALAATARNFADKLDSRANVTVTQPASLRARLASARTVAETETGVDETAATTTSPATSATAGGYRVQVFSDNNPRTAKREAQSKAAALSGTFPQWATYLTFDSPYWRLRVGDFRTYEDATQAVVELKNAFPAWRRELRVVRDRIKVTD